MAKPHLIRECDTCHNPFICFMVRDDVWREAGFADYDAARVCMTCFEKKLGRKLMLQDLPVPYISYCNEYWHQIGQVHADTD